jgi:nucleotide-binding universal stress UspA family protein
MIRVERILCPVDFSTFSARALRHAAVLAKWFKAEITVLHVMAGVGAPLDDFPPYLTPLPPDPQAREKILERLRAFVRPATEAGVRASVEVRQGDVVTQILREERIGPADLIVLGTHGLGGFERLVLGSVTEKILRKAACPVLTVPKEPDGVPAGEILFRSILCPVDFSHESLAALDLAVSLSESANARLTALYVLGWLAEEEPAEFAHFNVPEVRGHMEHDARERLQRAVDERSGGRTIDVAVVAGKPYRQILRVAREKEAGFIVMGVRGRGPVDLAFLGSTTNHVVREASCPVLTLRTG